MRTGIKAKAASQQRCFSAQHSRQPVGEAQGSSQEPESVFAGPARRQIPVQGPLEGPVLPWA